MHGNQGQLFTACAFLDIKSVFDSAWQPAILNGLIEKGCPFYLIKIIELYLYNRKGILSGPGEKLIVDIDLGCPQGSTLSPFLWNILIDKLLGAQYPFGFEIIAYADDLVLCTYDADPAIAVYHL